MTYEDIVALAKAGFTADQIAKLSAVQNTTQPTPPVVPPVQTQPVQTPPAVPPVQTQPVVPPVQTQPAVPPVQTQPAVPPVQTPYNSPDYILQAINSVNDTMRQMQINMSNQPKPETTDDIIASIINPPLPPKEGDK